MSVLERVREVEAARSTNGAPSVSVELTKADTNVVDCMIRLLPAKVNGYKINLEASTNSTGLIGISPTIS